MRRFGIVERIRGAAGLAAAALAAAVLTGAMVTSARAASAPFTPSPGSPYAGATIGSGDVGVNGVAFNPNGTLAAVTNSTAGIVTIYSAAPNGALTDTGYSEPVGTPVHVEFSPSGQYLAVLDLANKLFIFSVGANGALTGVAGSPFFDISGFGMAWSPSGNLIASLSGSDIAIFTVASGVPTYSTQIADSGNPISVAFSPNGQLLAVANETGQSVGLYSVSSSGAINYITQDATGSSSTPYWVAFNPQTGSSATAQLALADYGNAQVDLFSASASALTLQGSTQTGNGPRSVAFSPDGLLATANALSGSVSVFQVSPTSGTMTALPFSPINSGSGPVALNFADDGGTLAVANQYGNTAALFTVAAPSVSVTTPASGAVYELGQRVQVNFSCADGAFAPGLSYCGAPADGPGGPSTPQYLPTGTVGAQTLTVSAQSKDGQTTTQTISYTVVAPAAAVRSRSLLVSGDRTRLELGCTGGVAGARCAGRVAVTTTVRTGRRHRRRTVTLGSSRYSLLDGHAATVSVKLSGEAARLLAAAPKGRLRVSVTVTTAGQPVVARSLSLR